MMRYVMYGIAVLALAVPLAAQQDSTRPKGQGHQHCTGANCPAPGGGMGQGMGHGMGEGMGAMQGDGMGMMGMGAAMSFAPTRLLEHKDVLELTDQQVQRLTALRDATQKAHHEQHALAERYKAQMTQLAGSTDSAAVKGAFFGHHAAMGNAHWTMLSAAIQAKAILTERQRARADSLGHNR